MRGGCIVAVEMKLAFGLPVLYQAVERLSSADLVYVATAVPEGRKARSNWDGQLPAAVRLCRMLGIGLLSVRDGDIAVHAEPGPCQPRRQPRRRARLVEEFTRRSGDHNTGGTTRRPRVTAYREDALRIAQVLACSASMKPADVRRATGIAKAPGMLLGNVYGWFERPARGTYALAPGGRSALERYADVLAAQRRRDAANGGDGALAAAE
jgi:hypothetical protein